VVGARTIACEPLPANYALLRENVRLNRVESRVEALNVGVAGVDGTKQFSSCFGAKNHVVCPSEDIERRKRLELPVRTLDSLVKDRTPH
jgi:FkbM family methyltransferase